MIEELATENAVIVWPEGNDWLDEPNRKTVSSLESMGRWRPNALFATAAMRPVKMLASIASRPIEVTLASLKTTPLPIRTAEIANA